MKPPKNKLSARKKSQAIDPRQMYISACSFLISGILLKIPRKTKEGFFIGLAPSCTNIAMAAELFLKIIYHYEKSTIPNLHSLEVLFDSLGVQSHLKILITMEAEFEYPIQMTISEIKKHSEAFVEWRYLYEFQLDGFMFNFNFMISFCNALRSYISIIYHDLDAEIPLPLELTEQN